MLFLGSAQKKIVRFSFSLLMGFEKHYIYISRYLPQILRKQYLRSVFSFEHCQLLTNILFALETDQQTAVQVSHANKAVLCKDQVDIISQVPCRHVCDFLTIILHLEQFLL